MIECGAPGCGAPVADGYLCHDCTRVLQVDLDETIPELLAELDVTLSRQHRFQAPSGFTARSADKPVPFHPGASKMAAWAKSGLNRWVGWDDATQIRLQPWAGHMCHMLDRIISDMRAVVDRPPDTWYAGPCGECGADIYAKTSTGSVSCPECPREYDIEVRREALLVAMMDQLVTKADLCRAVYMLMGEQVSHEQVGSWVKRGKLTQKPPHPNDPTRPRYRIGDAVDLLRRNAA